MTEPTTPVTPAALPDDLVPKFSAAALIIDSLVRWVILGARNAGLLPEWAFWLSQALVLPMVVLGYVVTTETRLKIRLGLPLETKTTPSGGEFLSLLLSIFGGIVTYGLYPSWPSWLRGVLAFVAFVVYCGYCLGIAATATRVVPRDHSPEAGVQIEQPDWIDANDASVSRLDSERTSLHERVETYTVEATLFGTLAFSGFLALILEGPGVLPYTRTMLQTGWAAVVNVASLDDVLTLLRSLRPSDPSHYLAGVALGALGCSLFFLAVILARLRFGDAARHASYAITLLRGYEAKEDCCHLALLEQGVSESVHPLAKRLEALRVRVTEATYYADSALDALRPVVRYMAVFRTAGILAFLLALILSAAAISFGLAAAFSGVCSVAFLYPGLDRRVRDGKWLGIDFFRRGYQHRKLRRNASST